MAPLRYMRRCRGDIHGAQEPYCLHRRITYPFDSSLRPVPNRHRYGGTPFAMYGLELPESGSTIDISYVNWYNYKTEGHRSMNPRKPNPFPSLDAECSVPSAPRRRVIADHRGF